MSKSYIVEVTHTFRVEVQAENEEDAIEKTDEEHPDMAVDTDYKCLGEGELAY